MRFAWENSTLKLQPGPGPPHGGPTAEIHAKKSRENSRDEVPPIWTPFLTLIFGPVFEPRGSPAEKIHAENSRDAPGRSRAPFLIAFGPCFEPSLASLSELAFGIETNSRAFALR